jgi:hypothetical protein
MRLDTLRGILHASRMTSPFSQPLRERSREVIVAFNPDER